MTPPPMTPEQVERFVAAVERISRAVSSVGSALITWSEYARTVLPRARGKR